jgi:2-amino-4-hydroxy-6-hydroxymethyldihydropteridine diphosphokinase
MVSNPHKHCILVSLGSNINKQKNTQKGLNAMASYFGDMALSRVFESESVGFSGENFYNLVVKTQTAKSIDDVCAALKTIEQDCGRRRHAEKFSPRTLDLDLLTYDNVVCHEPVVLPREEIVYNAFVLQPMADLVPDDIHPITQQTYAQMWQDYDKTKQHLWPVTFAWSPP